MEVEPTCIDGCYIIRDFHASDDRGMFRKIVHLDMLRQHNITTDIFRESFYSISKRNVIRGMHFQLPPIALGKLVSFVSGTMLDVVYDLRSGSGTFGRYFAGEFSAKDYTSLYIPEGCAHGFASLTDESMIIYNVTNCHNRVLDAGFRYDSFGFDWPVENPVISQRDRDFPLLKNFQNPF